MRVKLTAQQGKYDVKRAVKDNLMSSGLLPLRISSRHKSLGDWSGRESLGPNIIGHLHPKFSDNSWGSAFSIGKDDATARKGQQCISWVVPVGVGAAWHAWAVACCCSSVCTCCRIVIKHPRALRAALVLFGTVWKPSPMVRSLVNTNATPLGE